MEIGAVKQAYNNEVILLKKKLKQAKIQTIHKLTRKAKLLAERKVPEHLKEKLNRKAESTVKEVLVIKKIKARDIARFAVTHSGELKDILNKSKVENERVCAKLLLHKSLQDKYKLIRERFANIPIKDLLMPRHERRKLKQEARSKQKNQKGKNNNKNNTINAEGHWDVEDIERPANEEDNDKDILSGHEGVSSDDSEDIDSENEHKNNSDIEEQLINGLKHYNQEAANEDDDDDMEITDHDRKFVIFSPPVENKHSLNNTISVNKSKVKPVEKRKKKPDNKTKENNKNKNYNEKLLLRKFNKAPEDTIVPEKKVVDPFFITSTGENYMSVAEPRQPDEVKEIHKQGNRKMRRAAMFGYVPKFRPNKDNMRYDNNKSDKHNGYERNTSGFTNKPYDRSSNNERGSNFKNKNAAQFNKVDQSETKVEKLHPSWEAKKRQSGILPFKGKKIVFDET